MIWLKRHDAALYGRIGHVPCAKDVISHFLGGSLSRDYSDAAGAGLINYRRRSYDRDLMTLYEVLNALTLLSESCEIAGLVSKRSARLPGLTAGIPVVADIFDVVASGGQLRLPADVYRCAQYLYPHGAVPEDQRAVRRRFA